MLPLDPQYTKQARKMLRQGASEASAAESLMMQGVSAYEANNAASQAKADHDKLAGYQKQALIAAALGAAGTLIGIIAATGGTIRADAMSIGPTLFVFGGIGWVLATFVSDLALWLVKRPLLIFIAAIFAMIGSLVGVLAWLR